jgi:hypothetical protein
LPLRRNYKPKTCCPIMILKQCLFNFTNKKSPRKTEGIKV